MRTRVYQVQVWHKNFPELLNVVIIVKTDLKTGRTAKVLLFSDDLVLPGETLIDYYSLRFQIEFNFRDAKQYWGLEDFMNVKETHRIINSLGKNTDDFLVDDRIFQAAEIGRIHAKAA